MFTCKLDEYAELKPLELHQADDLFQLVDENRAYLRQWLSWVDRNTRLQDSQVFIEQSLKEYAERKELQAGIWSNNKLVGLIGFHQVDWMNKRTSIGYWIAEECQGKGLVTRACQAMMEYVFKELQLNRVEIYCATDNLRSQKIPERLGFKKEGVFRQAAWLYDHFEDLVVYSMLAEEWKYVGPVDWVSEA